MKVISLDIANKHIRSANKSGKVVTLSYNGKETTYEKGDAELFHEDLEKGLYIITITDGEDKQEFATYIEEPAQETPPPAPAPVQPQMQISESALRDPTMLVIEMRRLDQISMENERRFHADQLEALRRTHNAEIERIKAEHKAEIERIKLEAEYKVKLVEGNQVKLEEDRLRQAEAIEKRLRLETRLGKKTEPGMMETLLAKALENPVLLMPILQKLGVNTDGMSAAVLQSALQSGMQNIKESGVDFENLGGTLK